MEYKDKITVVFNSKNRTLPSPLENPLFTLETPIENVRGVEIVSAIIPFSWYRFHIDESIIRTPSGSVAVYYWDDPVQETDATPTCTELANDIQTRVRLVLSWNDFVCTYSTSTYKFTLSRDTNFTIYVDETTVENSTLMKTIGFSVSLSGASSYTSEVPISDNRIRVNRNNSGMIIRSSTFTFSPGIYTGEELANEYKNKLDSSSGTTNYSVVYKKYRMKHSVINSVDAPNSSYLSDYNAALVLGHRNYSQNAYNNILEPTSCVDLTGTNIIKIKSTAISQFTKTNTISNQIYSVPINSEKCEYFINNISSLYKFEKYQTISYMDFRLTMDDDTFLNLNGIDWGICLNILI